MDYILVRDGSVHLKIGSTPRVTDGRREVSRYIESCEGGNEVFPHTPGKGGEFV